MFSKIHKPRARHGLTPPTDGNEPTHVPCHEPRAAPSSSPCAVNHSRATSAPPVVLVAGGYLGLALIWMAQALPRFTTSFAVDAPGPGDWLSNVFALRLAVLDLTSAHLGFSTTLLNAPQGVNLAWTALNYLGACVAVPITLVLGLAASYNSLLLVLLVANGTSMYWAATKWGLPNAAAVISGCTFMFCPYLIGQALMQHLDLLSAATVPIFFVLLRSLLQPTPRHPRTTGVLLGSLTGLQVFMSEEVLAWTLLAAAAAVLFTWVSARPPRHAWAPLLTASLWGAPVALSALALLSSAQALGGGLISGPAVGAGYYRTDLLGFVLPGQWELLTTSALKSYMATITPALGEATTYIGVPLLLLIFTMWRRGTPSDRHLALAIGVLAIVALGHGVSLAGHYVPIPFMPMSLLARIPMLWNLLPDRSSLVLDFALSLLVGRYIEAFWSTQRIVAASVVGLTLASWLPVLPIAYSPPLPPYFVSHPTHLRARPNWLILPFAQTGPTAMGEYWQAATGDRFNLVEGYYAARSVTSPIVTGPALTPATIDFFTITTQGRLVAPLDVAQPSFWAYLRRHDVALVIVGPEAHERLMLYALTFFMHRRPDYKQGVYVWRVPPGTDLGPSRTPAETKN